MLRNLVVHGISVLGLAFPARAAVMGTHGGGGRPHASRQTRRAERSDSLSLLLFGVGVIGFAVAGAAIRGAHEEGSEGSHGLVTTAVAEAAGA